MRRPSFDSHGRVVLEDDQTRSTKAHPRPCCRNTSVLLETAFPVPDRPEGARHIFLCTLAIYFSWIKCKEGQKVIWWPTCSDKLLGFCSGELSGELATQGQAAERLKGCVSFCAERVGWGGSHWGLVPSPWSSVTLASVILNKGTWDLPWNRWPLCTIYGTWLV